MALSSKRPARRVLCVVVALGCTMLCVRALAGGVDTAAAAAPPPTPASAWGVTIAGIPTVLPPGLGRRGKYYVVVENIGGATAEGPVTVKDDLPPGLTVTGLIGEPAEGVECSEGGSEAVCNLTAPVVSGGFIVMKIDYEVTGSVGLLKNLVSVSGGNTPSATSENNTRLGGEHEKGPAGIAEFNVGFTGPAGEPVTQAGGHPHFMTTSVLFNNMYVEGASEPIRPVEAVRNFVFYLPLGVLGDATVAEPCPASIVETASERTGCPPSSRVGTVLPMLLSTLEETADPTHGHGIYSVTPEKGYAAEFAFTSNGYTFLLYANVVRRDGTYMLRVAVPGVAPSSALIGAVATFYGDIQEHFTAGEGEEGTFDRGSFLTDPTDCGEDAAAREAAVAMDTFEHPDPLLAISASVPVFSNIAGCELLGFSANLGVRPETTQADAPSGYEVGLEVPQASKDASGLATPPVKDLSVTLPEGTTISPSSANGLLACQATGPQGINIEGPESEEVAADGLLRPAVGHCPPAAQIGTVTASIPLLQEGLTGRMFVAAPDCGGSGQRGCTEEDASDGGLFGLYVEMEGPGSGVIIKLEGKASVNPGTGQITAVFNDAPQFPFSKLVVTMKGGPRAVLANPQACGLVSSRAQLTPWSSPVTPAATSEDSFRVDWDGSGSGCPTNAPFAPALTTTMTNQLAAATSPFVFTLKREDREQDIGSLSSTFPEGMLADIAKVVQCAGPQVSLDECPAASQIGTTTVAVGSGSAPYYVTGKVFFTGPYGGAPFGLSIVVPAAAGPFNLGNVFVRVALFIDPHTTRVTAVSGPLPQMLDGVPLRIRSINLTISDSEFVLNPTNCAPTSVTGVVYTATGATASVSSPFAAVGCNNLPFKPAVSISTEAKSTKANGTGVRIKIENPSRGEANLEKLVIGFPKQLPVRLETLRQACRARTFEADPAACPPASDIGMTTVHTPILAQPLIGPVYLVSYGSAKFPDAVLVLQGDGVTIEADGQTFISHSGAVKVTFASVPDAPFTTLETVIPAGRYSEFTSSRTTSQARASQCGEKLLAPVSLTAHNGAQMTATARLTITACRPTVSLTGAHVRASGLAVSVRTSARGLLRISGPGLKTLELNLGEGTHRLTVAFTHVGRLATLAHRKMRVHMGLVVGNQRVSKDEEVAL